MNILKTTFSIYLHSKDIKALKSVVRQMTQNDLLISTRPAIYRCRILKTGLSKKIGLSWKELAVANL